MQKVSIYIETSLKGPCVKDGWYATTLEYVKTNGEIETRNVFGTEEETTYHRLVLLGIVKTLDLLNVGCDVTVYTDSKYIINQVECENPEAWNRSEWLNAKGKGVIHKDLWQQFLEQKEKHQITLTLSKHHEYSMWLKKEAIRRVSHAKKSK